MKRLSIKASLTAVFASIAIISAALGYIAINGLATTNNATTEISTNWLPSVELVNTINTATSDFRIGEGAHIMSTNEAEMAAAEADIKAVGDSIVTLRKKYEALISSDHERQVYEQFSKEWADYLVLHEKLLTLSRANQNEEAAKLFKGQMDTDYDAASNLLVELIKINHDGSEQAYASSGEAYSSTRVIMFSALGFVGLVVFGSMIFAMTGIARPINRITDAMKALAGGDTASEVPFAGRADEIGSMAGAVEVFRQAAIANKRLEAEAEENRRKAEADRIASQEKAEADAAERLRVATSGLAAGLKRLAAGDLAFQLTEAFAPDFEALRHDFNQSVSQLGAAMSSIAGTASSIDNGTREIAAGANDLSKRTEQQAASLEETAAALDEITANVTSSTKRTEEARSVATRANQSAVKSAEVVSTAEEAMKKIEASSQQISNIIGVIDEIAFQTNLLALNAGVEAARAGDAGKGFAVVAQEVRELAQRSAQAAKEIKALIQTSSTEVEGGVKLVRDAGEALKTIGGFIVEINGHMEAIATSAREQSVGLAEVNTAVNSMDQTTQQNAAMVEQSNAASNSLAQEAMRLRDLVGQFQIDGIAAAQSSALRQVAHVMAQAPARPAYSAPARRATASGGAAVAVKDDWQEF
ncbi:methyl-accepting chemotaxis protein [Rhizobium sp. PAMB 3174]